MNKTNEMTVTEIAIGQYYVDIKSKRDDRHHSGWSVIAFTPSCSLRCVKCNREDTLLKFASAVVAATADDEETDATYEDYITLVIDAVKSITLELDL